MAVVRDQARAILKRLYKKGCKNCLLIIDDTQTIKRAKRMQLPLCLMRSIFALQSSMHADNANGAILALANRIDGSQLILSNTRLANTAGISCVEQVDGAVFRDFGRHPAINLSSVLGR